MKNLTNLNRFRAPRVNLWKALGVIVGVELLMFIFIWTILNYL